MTPRLLRNKWKTPDGTILESRHRHDYVGHDDADGNTYFVDGGQDYIRSTGGMEDLCVYFEDQPHEFLRDNVFWGPYGKNGDQPLKYIPISEMTTGHLAAVITTQTPTPWLKEVIDTEYSHRTNQSQRP